MPLPQTAQAFLTSLTPLECTICTLPLDAAHPPVMVDGCRHVFGADCLKKWVESDNNGHDTCPTCRNPLYAEAQGDHHARSSSGRTLTQRLRGLLPRTSARTGAREQMTSRFGGLRNRIRGVEVRVVGERNRIGGESRTGRVVREDLFGGMATSGFDFGDHVQARGGGDGTGRRRTSSLLADEDGWLYEYGDDAQGHGRGDSTGRQRTSSWSEEDDAWLYEPYDDSEARRRETSQTWDDDDYALSMMYAMDRGVMGDDMMMWR